MARHAHKRNWRKLEKVGEDVRVDQEQGDKQPVMLVDKPLHILGVSLSLDQVAFLFLGATVARIAVQNDLELYGRDPDEAHCQTCCERSKADTCKR